MFTVASEWSLPCALLACVVVSCGLGACGGDEPPPPNPGPATIGPPPSDTTETPSAPPDAPSAAAVCAGARHTCVVTDDRRVQCAGDGLDGQLGDGRARPRVGFAAVPGLTDVTDIACGAEHTCAVREGMVHCWGRGDQGQAGDPGDAHLRPRAVEGVLDAVQVVAGATFTCVRSGAGEVRCFGRRPGGPDELDVRVLYAPNGDEEGSRATDIAAGDGHVCVLRADGHVRCWGDDRAGQSGANPEATVDAAAVPIEGVVDVEAGGSNTCFLLEDRTARCIGAGSRGQLGDGRRSSASFQPVEVINVTEVHRLTVGAAHACVTLGEHHGVACWGDPRGARLGDPALTEQAPRVVEGVTGARGLAAGGSHTCAVIEGGLSCWGAGALAHGTRAGGEPPRRFTLPRGEDPEVPEALSAAPEGLVTPDIGVGDDYLCVLDVRGEVSCWGSAEAGRLGNGTTRDARDRARRVRQLSGATQLSVGEHHACVRLADGRVACWGRQAGGFGDGVVGPSGLPVEVPAFRGATEVSAGDGMTCARMEDGRVLCSGAVMFPGTRRVGGAPPGSEGPTTRPVSGLDDAEQVSAGFGLACARRANGRAACWGPASGRTDGYTELRGLAAVVDISVGHREACAVSRGGRVFCWEGTVGTGGLSFPQYVPRLAPCESVRVGGNTRCVRPRRRAHGDFLCWGRNRSGQVGVDSEEREIEEPTGVSDAHLEHAGPRIAMSCGRAFCCALHETGEVSCAGGGMIGRLAGADGGRAIAPIVIPMTVAVTPAE